MNSQNTELKGRKIAILATDGFEQSELMEPKKNLENAGAKVDVLSIKEGKIKGWDKTDWGSTVKVDRMVGDAKPAEYDALVLPGGVISRPSTNRQRCGLVCAPVCGDGETGGAICHGPWTLIEAGVVRNRTMTSWPSVHTDLTNAGVNWVDQEVVTDHNIITSRKPEDIPAFSRAIVQAIKHSAQHFAKAS